MAQAVHPRGTQGNGMRCGTINDCCRGCKECKIYGGGGFSSKWILKKCEGNENQLQCPDSCGDATV